MNTIKVLYHCDSSGESLLVWGIQSRESLFLTEVRGYILENALELLRFVYVFRIS